MSEVMKQFLEFVSKQEKETREKLTEMEKAEVIAFAKENGFALTDADFETGEEDEELTLDEAKAVSGGSFSCNCTTMGVGVIGTEMDMPGTFGDGK